MDNTSRKTYQLKMGVTIQSLTHIGVCFLFVIVVVRELGGYAEYRD